MASLCYSFVYVMAKEMGMDDEERAQPDTVVHADVTIEEVEAFIDELPNEYRFLAIFVYATAAPPEAAISLEVEAVKSMIT